MRVLVSLHLVRSLVDGRLLRPSRFFVSESRVLLAPAALNSTTVTKFCSLASFACPRLRCSSSQVSCRLVSSPFFLVLYFALISRICLSCFIFRFNLAPVTFVFQFPLVLFLSCLVSLCFLCFVLHFTLFSFPFLLFPFLMISLASPTSFPSSVLFSTRLSPLLLPPRLSSRHLALPAALGQVAATAD